MLREAITVCCEKGKEDTSMLRGQNAEIKFVTDRGG
jgi:hypothetical protein